MTLPEPRHREAGEAATSGSVEVVATGSLIRWVRVGLLVAADTAAVLSAATLAYFGWARWVRNQRPELYLDLLPLLPLLFLVYAAWGLYPGFGLGAVEMLRRMTLATSGVFLGLAAVVFAFKLPHLYSRMTFVLAWALALLLVPLGRMTVLVWARRRSWWGEPCVLVGAGGMAERAVGVLDRALTLGYRPVVSLRLGDEASGDSEVAVAGVPIVGDVADAPKFAARGVRIALMASDGDLADTAATAEFLRRSFQRVLVLRDLGGLPVEGVEMKALGGMVGMEFTNRLLLRRNRVLKRMLDLALGSLGLALACPLIVLGALAVSLNGRCSPWFRHRREGRGGREFVLWKLRTMRVDAEERLEDFLEDDPAAREAWERHRKLRRDPRVIRPVGAWLRRWSLDELPQLWHVVSGEMSLVGPRPFPEDHLCLFSAELRELRRRVRPGLTGLWQVMVRGDGTIDDQQAFDAYYIRNWSLWLDLYLLGRTVAAVLKGRGAY